MLKFRDEVSGPAEEGPEGGPPGPSLESQTIKGTPSSEAENTILRAAFKSGDKEKIVAAHAQIAAARSGEKTEAPAGQGPAPAPTPQMVQPPNETDTTEDPSADPFAEFTAQTGGVVDQANMELLGKHTAPWARGLDEIMARYPGDTEKQGTALAEHIRKGEDQVIIALYGGNEAAMLRGVQEIDQALDKLPNGAKLRDALNENRILADRASHHHILTLARMVNKRLAKK